MTDLQYWEVEAREYGKVMSTGRTKPVTFSCVGCPVVLKPSGDVLRGSEGRNDFVVKICGCNEMTDRSRTLEFVAGMLGQCLGVPVVEPAIVRFPADLVPLLPEPKKSALRASSDRQFGSKHLGSAWFAYSPGKSLEQRLREQALCILVFDLLIQNVDRRQAKPNVLTDGRDIKAFDHEMAFSFLSSIGDATPAWQVRHFGWVRNHVFLKVLKGRDCDLTPCLERIRALDDIVFDRIRELIPAEWSSTELDGVARHCRNVKENLSLFSEELREVLT